MTRIVTTHYRYKRLPRIPLTGGAYTARSVIAATQRSVNLFAEPMPQAEGEPAQMEVMASVVRVR